MAKFNADARRLARRLALQGLYQWFMTGYSADEIEQQFINRHDMGKVDQDYFHELIQQVPSRFQALDEQLSGYLDRQKERLNAVELSVLRLGCYELSHRLDIPANVVIYEAVALAKKFGSEDGYKYVNGVLDQLANTLRSSEYE